MKVSVVVPMYNESSIIEDSIATFSSFMSENFDDYELIFSDDGSTDGCGDIVKKHSESDNRIILSRYEKNRGKGCAVRTGVLKSTGDIVIYTDCDLAFGVDVVKKVYDRFMSDMSIEVIAGSRNLSADGYEGYTLLRKIASKIYIKFICLIAGFKLTDSQCGIKGFKGERAREIFSQCTTDGFAFDFEVLLSAHKLGCKCAEIPVKIINHRQSTVHVFSDSFKMLHDLMKIKKNVKKRYK